MPKNKNKYGAFYNLIFLFLLFNTIPVQDCISQNATLNRFKVELSTAVFKYERFSNNISNFNKINLSPRIGLSYTFPRGMQFSLKRSYFLDLDAKGVYEDLGIYETQTYLGIGYTLKDKFIKEFNFYLMLVEFNPLLSSEPTMHPSISADIFIPIDRLKIGLALDVYPTTTFTDLIGIRPSLILAKDIDLIQKKTKGKDSKANNIQVLPVVGIMLSNPYLDHDLNDKFYLGISPNYGIELFVKKINLSIELRRSNWVKLMSRQGGLVTLDSLKNPIHISQGSLINEHFAHFFHGIKYHYKYTSENSFKFGIYYTIVKKDFLLIERVPINKSEEYKAISLLHSIPIKKFDLETRADLYLGDPVSLFNFGRLSLGLMYRI